MSVKHNLMKNSPLTIKIISSRSSVVKEQNVSSVTDKQANLLSEVVSANRPFAIIFYTAWKIKVLTSSCCNYLSIMCYYRSSFKFNQLVNISWGVYM